MFVHPDSEFVLSRVLSLCIPVEKNDVPDPSDCKKRLVSDEGEEGEEGKDRENGKIGKKISRKIGACWEYGIESSFAVASKRYPGEIRRGEIKERGLKHISYRYGKRNDSIAKRDFMHR